MKLMSKLLSAIALAAVPFGGASANEVFTFQMSWKAQVEFAGYYLAEAKGYYKECGLDLTVRDGAPGIDPAQLLAAGAVDAAILPHNDAVLQLNKAGFQARAVMAALQKFPSIMLYHKESGIKAPEDLAGKPILISQANRVSFWPFLKAKYNLSDDQLRTYNGQIATWMSDKNAVQQGSVTQEPFRVQKELGEFPSYFMLSDLGYNPYSAIVTVSQKMIDEKPEAVKCLVGASAKGWAEFMNNPKETFPILAAKNDQMTDDLMNYTYSTLKDKEMVLNSVTAEKGVGAISEDRWKAHFDVMVANGSLPADFDYKATFTDRFTGK